MVRVASRACDRSTREHHWEPLVGTTLWSPADRNQKGRLFAHLPVAQRASCNVPSILTSLPVRARVGARRQLGWRSGARRIVHHAALDPNSGTASFRTVLIVIESSPSIACSSAAIHFVKFCIGGSLGLAAMMPATPISTGGS